MSEQNTCEVLCLGASSYDISLLVAEHPEPDSKSVADQLCLCGGGPAANAAFAINRLGHKAAFLGYLGDDSFGDSHLAELQSEGVNTDFINRGPQATPLSVVLAKPNGDSSLVNYSPKSPSISFSHEQLKTLSPKLILFDGRHPEAAADLIAQARAEGIKSMLDAGSLHEGTKYLASKVDYLICSQKFAREFCSTEDMLSAVQQLSALAPTTVITLGKHGLIWKSTEAHGSMDAFEIEAIDGVGAGDAFHAALCVAILRDMDWSASLEFASAAGALTTSKLGARTAFPDSEEIEAFLSRVKRTAKS
jgi:sulfofructose kinase